MKKLTTLNRALENVPENNSALASAYTLKKAYEMNVSDINRRITQLTTTKDENGATVSRILTEEEQVIVDNLNNEKDTYSVGIAERNATLGDFQPTAKDSRLLWLVACGNRDDMEETGIRFGRPTYKVGDTVHERLLGFGSLCKNLEAFKAYEREYEPLKPGEQKTAKRKQEQDKYNALLDNLVSSLKTFMNWNYCTDNTSADSYMHTSVFDDGIKFEVNRKFARYIASLSCFDLKISKGHVLEEKFSERVFFNSLCAWFYIKLTKGNKYDTRYTAPAIVKMDANASQTTSKAKKSGKKSAEKSAEKPVKESVSESATPEKAEPEKAADTVATSDAPAITPVVEAAA